MALEEVTAAFLRRFDATLRTAPRVSRQCRAYSATARSLASDDIPSDLDSSSFLSVEPEIDRDYDPTRRARTHKTQLPPSSYRFRSPRYNYGALNPHRPLKASDPNSREFIPGPFSLPRLQQTYQDTFAPDLMTLTYAHFPPGYVPHVKAPRRREWTGDSPYFKNRPLRPPRGGDTLRLLRKPVNFNNIPRLEKVVVHTMVKDAQDDSAYLAVAGMGLQAMTGVRAKVFTVKRSDASFGLRAGQNLSLTCELKGEDMYHFLSKLVDVFMPKIKDYKGVKGSSGDSSGNIAFGFTPEQVGLFPEIEVNYDQYPTNMLPGCHVVIQTSASTDKDARLLLRSIGIPFYGKLVD